MSWKIVALIGSVLAGMLFVAVPQPASALPGSAPRADVAGSHSVSPIDQVRRRYWRGRRYGYYRPYRYRRYGYSPYYYDSPYYYSGYPYYYRRPGFGIYLGF
jgi:hypothetical protein